MASWTTFEQAAPELAASVAALLDAHRHKTLATLRRDGSPRISGTEADLRDGELWIGSMPGALKARYLLRDPRFALHSGSDDPPEWPGDAKLAGHAVEVTDPAAFEAARSKETPPGPFHLFRLDLHEVSTVGLTEDRKALVIRLWTPEGGVREMTRT